MRVLHIGKKVPKGWKEIGASMHLGKGIWMFNCEPPNVEALIKYLEKKDKKSKSPP